MIQSRIKSKSLSNTISTLRSSNPLSRSSNPLSPSTLSLSSSFSFSTSRCYASVSDPSLKDVLDHNQANAQGLSPAQKAAMANAAPQLNKAVVEMKRERKLAQYAKNLKAKAIQEGYSSVEEFREAKLKEAADIVVNARAQAAAAASSTATSSSSSSTSSAPSASNPSLTATEESDSSAGSRSETTEERDSRVMREIRARAEAEARRKLESGELGSGPGGKSPVKPLSEIIDISKFSSETPERITELWTGYHTLKNKLSAVIPASTYRSLISNAQKYPQFVLPLGRKVIDGEEEEKEEGKSTSPEEIKEKQGFEMQFLEWAFLPHPPRIQSKDSPQSPIPIEEIKKQNSDIKIPKPSTVLFTPLAEYKLRQSFAQPVLILTHYIDLIESHGIVLMRGDITGSNDEQTLSEAPASSIHAIQDAIQKGKTESEIQELSKPIQSQGRIGMKESQILTMMLQRFYVDFLSGMDSLEQKVEKGTLNKVDNMEIRAKLLRDFHTDPQSFDVDLLIKAAYMM